MELLDKFLDWLSIHGPFLILALVAGYHYGGRGRLKTERELIKTELELALERNEDAIRKASEKKSDLEHVLDMAEPKPGAKD